MNIGLFLGITAVVILVIYYISLCNNEVRLRNLVEAQQKICQANFDKMWKVIRQITHVSDQYIDTFKEVYPKMIAGRYTNDSKALGKFISEMNPDFDTSVMRQLNNAIEAHREEFFSDQQLLIARRNEHKTFIEVFPANMLLPWARVVDIAIITSDYTQEVYASQKENI